MVSGLLPLVPRYLLRVCRLLVLFHPWTLPTPQVQTMSPVQHQDLFLVRLSLVAYLLFSLDSYFIHYQLQLRFQDCVPFPVFAIQPFCSRFQFFDAQILPLTVCTLPLHVSVQSPIRAFLVPIFSFIQPLALFIWLIRGLLLLLPP